MDENDESLHASSDCQLEALPEEVLIHTLSFLDGRSLALCLSVSKHINAIASDESLWKECCNQFSAGWLCSLGSNEESWRKLFISLMPPAFLYDRTMWLKDASAIVSLVVYGTITATGTISVRQVLLGGERNSGESAITSIRLSKANYQHFELGDSSVFLLICTADGLCFSINPPPTTPGSRSHLLPLAEWENYNLRNRFLSWRRDRRGNNNNNKFVNPLISCRIPYAQPEEKESKFFAPLSSEPSWWLATTPEAGKSKDPTRPWEKLKGSGFHPQGIHKNLIWCKESNDPRRLDCGLFVRYTSAAPASRRLDIFLVHDGFIEFSWRFRATAGRIEEIFKLTGRSGSDLFETFAHQSPEGLVMNREEFEECMKAHLTFERTVSGLRFIFQTKSGLLRKYSVVDKNREVKRVGFRIERRTMRELPAITELASFFIEPSRRRPGLHPDNFMRAKTGKKASSDSKYMPQGVGGDIFGDLVAALQRRRANMQRNIFGEDGEETSEESSDEDDVAARQPTSLFDHDDESSEIVDDIFGGPPPPPARRKPISSGLFGSDDEDESEPLFRRPPSARPLPTPTKSSAGSLFDDDSTDGLFGSATTATTTTTSTPTGQAQRSIFDDLDDPLDDPFGQPSDNKKKSAVASSDDRKEKEEEKSDEPKKEPKTSTPTGQSQRSIFDDLDDPFDDPFGWPSKKSAVASSDDRKEKAEDKSEEPEKEPKKEEEKKEEDNERRELL